MRSRAAPPVRPDGKSRTTVSGTASLLSALACRLTVHLLNTAIILSRARRGCEPTPDCGTAVWRIRPVGRGLRGQHPRLTVIISLISLMPPATSAVRNGEWERHGLYPLQATAGRPAAPSFCDKTVTLILFEPGGPFCYTGSSVIQKKKRRPADDGPSERFLFLSKRSFCPLFAPRRHDPRFFLHRAEHHRERVLAAHVPLQDRLADRRWGPRLRFLPSTDEDPERSRASCRMLCRRRARERSTFQR